MTHKEMAAEIRRAAALYLAEGMIFYPNDPEMNEMHREDDLALRTLADLVEQDKIAEAWRYAWTLDTMVRDVIPGKVYCYIGTIGEDE